MNQALQQVRQAVGQVAGKAAQGVQGAAGGALRQAQETSGQVAQQQGGGGKEEPNATLAAKQKAKELGVDLSQVEGSGTEGSITLKDVPDAIKQG